MDSIQCDLAVVGGGLAGMCAAIRGAELGLSVILLERSGEDLYLCNTRYSGGLFHVGMQDMGGEPDEVLGFIRSATNDCADPLQAGALADHGKRTLAWLRSHSVRFISIGPDGLRRHSLAPPAARRIGLAWRGRAGDVMLRTLRSRLISMGARVMQGVQARELQMSGGVCTGLIAELGQAEAGKLVSLKTAAVVLADGGFQANTELVRRFISARPERLLQRNAGSGLGAGLQMAENAGAKLTGTSQFYGHLHYVKAMEDERFWPFPVLDPLATAGMIVGADGRRFCDEGKGGVWIANSVAKLADPLSTTVIFDDAVWHGTSRGSLFPVNPNFLDAGGELVSAGSIAELAARLSLDATALQATIDAHNAVAAGQYAALDVPRSVAPYAPWVLQHAPFHAIPVCAGITYTMGGIAIDGGARVLHTNGAAISGLYAAGATTGGLEGGPAAGYTGGLSKASVFGMLAAESAADYMESIR